MTSTSRTASFALTPPTRPAGVRRGRWHLATVALVLACCAAACGSDTATDPDAPVAVTFENLEGYWHSANETAPLGKPIVLHFGPSNASDADPMGSLQLVEVVGAGLPSIGPVVLGDDGTFAFQRVIDGQLGTYLQGTMELTSNELTLHFDTDGSTVRFERSAGCGAPGTWLDAGFQITDMGWGPDGSLHILQDPNASVADRTGFYVFVPPGRCTPFVPETSATGHTIDVAPDGTVRILNVGPTSIRFVEIEPAPWTRSSLEPRVVELSDTLGTTYVRPTGRIADVDGRAHVIWTGRGGVYTWRENDDGTFASIPIVENGTGITPQYARMTRDHDGTPFVTLDSIRTEPPAFAYTLESDTWVQWTIPTHPDYGPPLTFTWDPSGQFYGAWSVPAVRGGADIAVIGALDADGRWTLVEAGPGRPFDMAARADRLDLATIDSIEQSPLYWTQVDLPLRPGGWRSSMAHDNLVGGTLLTAQIETRSEYPLARFGPSGEVALGGFDLLWRAPASEPADDFLWLTQQMEFALEDGAAATIDVPDLDVSCDASCEFRMEPGSVVPLFVQGTDALARPRVFGSAREGTPDIPGEEWMLFAPRLRFGQGDAVQSIVRGEVSRLTAARVETTEDPTVVTGFDVAGAHSFVGTRTTLLHIAGSGETSERAFIRIDAVQGRADGSSRVVGSDDGVTTTLFDLDASLSTVTSIPLEGAAVLDEDGAWEAARTDTGTLAVYRHDARGRTWVADTPHVAGSLLGDASGFYVTHPNPDGSGLQQITRYASAGAAVWTVDYAISSTDAPLLALRGENLVVYAHSTKPIVVDGAQVPSSLDSGFERHGFIELAADSGAIATELAGDGTWPRPEPGGIDADDAGFALISSQTTSLDLLRVSPDGDVVRSTYMASVDPGHCLQPGAQCGTLAGRALLVGASLQAVWLFSEPFELDDTPIEPMARFSLALGAWSF